MSHDMVVMVKIATSRCLTWICDKSDHINLIKSKIGIIFTTQQFY